MSTQDETKVQLPVSVRLNPELSMFMVTRYRGKLQNGGFGVPVSLPIDKEGDDETDTDAVKDQAVAKSSEDAEESSAVESNAEDTAKPTTITKEHLFVEDVVFLHERGLVEVNDDMGSLLNSSHIYNLLEPLGLSLPVYLANAHLRAQTYRVVRHTPGRRQILEGMESLLRQSGNDEEEESIHNGVKTPRRCLRDDAISAAPPKVATSSSPSIAFDVYQPDSNFSRSNPGLPDFYVAVTYYNEPRLDFGALVSLLQECQGVPLKIATVSDAGTVIMFGITDAGAPEPNNERSQLP